MSLLYMSDFIWNNGDMIDIGKKKMFKGYIGMLQRKINVNILPCY